MPISILLIVVWGLFSLPLGAQNYTQTGPYGVVGFDTTFAGGPTSGTDVSAHVWVPVDSQTGAIPVGQAFPVLVFGHGFLMGHRVYDNILEHLAGWGYAVASVDEQTGASPNHLQFAQQMADVLLGLQAANLQPGSRFHQRLGPAMAAFGHSMGGGCALLVQSVFPGLLAVAGLSPAETSTSAIAACSTLSIPALIISGQGDAVTPIANHQAPMYDAVIGPKLHISLKDGGHCRYTDQANPTCDLGATLVGDAGTLTHAQQQRISLRYLVPFFEYSLKNRTEALPWLCGTEASQDDSVLHWTTFSCTVSRAQNLAENTEIRVWPNPSNGLLEVSAPQRPKLFSLNGGLVEDADWVQSDNRWTLTHELPAGIYILIAGGKAQRLAVVR